jgi:hypothetical protein
MSVSLKSQVEAMRMVSDASPAQLVRAGLAPRPALAELLRTQLSAAFATLALIESDERLRAYAEKMTRKSHERG